MSFIRMNLIEAEGDFLLINLDRKKSVPMYLQLTEEIKKLIQKGTWEAGKKVPTERELADNLHISRNTVTSAYKELEVEGILISTQGRGTFVTDSDEVVKRESRKDRLLKIIDIALEESAELGFSIDEFLMITNQRVAEKKDRLMKVKVAFVECNREQLDQFSRNLRLEPSVSIVPILLTDFIDHPDEVQQLLADTDLILTTFFHLDEVKSLIALGNKHIIGIALDPQLETIVKIARLPQGTRLGIVSLSDTFGLKVINALKRAGIDHLQVVSTTAKDIKKLSDFIDQVDALVVSPSRHKAVTTINRNHKAEIEFMFLPDQGSINAVKTALLEIKQK